MATQTFTDDLKMLRRSVARYFPDLVDELEIVLAVCASLKINNISQPMAVWLLGPPSSGKTTILDCIKQLPAVLWRDDFSAASILSASAGMAEEDSLLPQLNNHVLVIPELAPLSKNKESKVLLSYMTRLLDSGSFVRHSGSTGRIGFTSPQRFNWLGALVDVSPALMQQMGTMGHRLFMIRLPVQTRTFDDRTRALTRLTKGRPYEAKLEVVRRMILAFFQNLDKYYPDGVSWDSMNDDDFTKSTIAKFTILLTNLRATFPKQGPPLIEHENRAFQFLMGLAKSCAFISGRSHIEPQELKTTARMCLDSAVPWRSDMLRLLINKNNMSADEYVSLSGCCAATASIRFRQMVELGIAKITTESGTTKPYNRISLDEQYHWLLDKRLKQYF